MSGPARPLLVLRALGLGDALTGVAALRGLRRLHPDRPLVLAAPAVLGGWLRDLGVVDDVVPTDGLDDDPPGLGLGAHDAVDLHGRGPQSHRLLLAGDPASLLAFAVPGLVAGPPWREDEHEVLRWCRLVASAGGACGPGDLLLSPTARPGPAGRTARRPRLPRRPTASRHEPPTGPVLLHPGAASGSRRWPVARWAEVARGLSGSQHVLVTGGAQERDLAAEVADGAGLTRDRVLAGTTDLSGLAGLVAEAGLLVCGDTGVAHLATALDVPSVLLFGPVSPLLWGPAVSPSRHAVLWHGDGRGDPHGDEADEALLRIQVPEVLAAARRLLSRPRAGAG